MKQADATDGSVRRQVARRACLSCREKKIKCDGESVNKTSEEGKETSDEPKICSNCKMLGVECVFVQSMRGGRRKKRTLSIITVDETEKTRAKAAKATQSTQSTQEYEEKLPGNINQERSRVGSVSSFTTEEYKRGTYSPSMSYTSPPFQNRGGGGGFNKERIAMPGKQEMNEYMQGYPGHYEEYDSHFSPRMHHRKHGHHQPFLPPFYQGPPDDHHRFPGDHHHGPPGDHHHGPPGDHHHGPPGPKPPFHHHHCPPHQRKPPHLRKFFDKYPPPWYPYPPSFPEHVPMFGYQLPPPPPPPRPSQHHHQHHGPNLPYGGSELLSNPSKDHLKPGETSSDRSQFRFPYSNQEGSMKNSGESLSTKSYGSFENPYYYNGEMDMKSDPAKSKKASTSSNNSVVSDDYDPPYSLKGSESNYLSDNRYILRGQAFSDTELATYELPKWDILNRVLDYYYAFKTSNHMLLLPKSVLLKNIALSRDSSIIHALIASVCSTLPANIHLQKDEHHWISLTFRFWDNLDDFGMLMTYTLISKTSQFRIETEKIIEMNKKKWDLIESNMYLDILVSETPKSLNSRQIYQREMIIRMVWNYWMTRTLLIRYITNSTSVPPYELASNSGKSLNDFLPKIPFPGCNDNYFFTNKRRNLEELSGIDLTTNFLNGAESLIYSIRVFEDISSKIHNDNLDQLVLLNESIANDIESRIITNIEKRNLISIKANYLTAGQILFFSDCLQQLSFLKSILVFNEQRAMFTSRISLVSFMNDISRMDLLSFDTLPHAIKSLSDFQWNCIVNLIYSLKKLTALLDLDGKNPNARFIMESTTLSEEEPSALDGIIGDQYSTWLKYNDFSIICYSYLLPVFSNLILLTKFIQISKEGSHLRISILHTDIVKYLLCPQKVLDVVVESFKLDALYKRLTLIVDFIKITLGWYLESFNGETITKMNRIVHYLNEILNSIKIPV